MVPGPEKQAALKKQMKQLGIRPEDIEVRFIKSSGRGGQKVNKSASAVFVRHVPTGIGVKCGKSRSQTLNRFLALRRLVEQVARIDSSYPADARVERIRKQKKRRRRRCASTRHSGPGIAGQAGGQGRENHQGNR